jgi:hypothetical protein
MPARNKALEVFATRTEQSRADKPVLIPEVHSQSLAKRLVRRFLAAPVSSPWPVLGGCLDRSRSVDLLQSRIAGSLCHSRAVHPLLVLHTGACVDRHHQTDDCKPPMAPSNAAREERKRAGATLNVDRVARVGSRACTHGALQCADGLSRHAVSNAPIYRHGCPVSMSEKNAHMGNSELLRTVTSCRTLPADGVDTPPAEVRSSA